MKQQRVLVCGGRDYQESAELYKLLDAIWKTAHFETMVIIQGGADGADRLAREWCLSRLVPFDNFAADWKRSGKAAGPIRNQRMIDEGKPSLVIACPGGRGTYDMIRRAQAANIPVFQIGRWHQ